MTETLETLFCRTHGCTQTEFERKIFWDCLHRHAVPVAPFILAVNRKFFLADRELIASAGAATSMSDVLRHAEEFLWHPNNKGWLRRQANIRVSGRRLIKLAMGYLMAHRP
jgi:hypothetical protein